MSPSSSAPEKMSTLSAFNTVFNVMLSSGPILVPPVFQEPGLVLACIFIVVIMLISIVCAEFIVESMSLLTVIRTLRRKKNLPNESSTSNENISIHDNSNSSLITSENGNWMAADPLPEEFEFKESIEYGQIALELFGKPVQGFVTFVLAIYLVGVLSSKTIMIGSILSKAFSDVDILDNRYVWILSFFLLTVIFSFRNVQKTKILQDIIVIVRFFTIFSLLAGAFQVISINGVRGIDERGSYFDFSNFASFFSNLQFALLMHHAIPQMVSNVKNQKDIKKILFAAITIGALSIILLSITGILAFGECLDAQFVAGCAPDYPNKSSYYNNFFKGIAHTDWVFYISSFYVFLNIAAFPVLIITARNNLMKFFAKKKIPAQNFLVTKWTVSFTLIFTIPILTIALVTTNIQLVLDWISGIFGSLLISILPSVFLIKARQTADKLGINRSNNLHTSSIKHKSFPYILLAIGSGLLTFTIYNNFKKYT